MRTPCLSITFEAAGVPPWSDGCPRAILNPCSVLVSMLGSVHSGLHATRGHNQRLVAIPWSHVLPLPTRRSAASPLSLGWPAPESCTPCGFRSVGLHMICLCRAPHCVCLWGALCYSRLPHRSDALCLCLRLGNQFSDWQGTGLRRFLPAQW